MSTLLSLAGFQQIKLISAKVASVKVNNTKVPAFLCSLDVGPSLLEVQLHLRQKSGLSTCASYQLALAKRLLCGKRFLFDMAAHVLGLLWRLHYVLLVGYPSHFVSCIEPETIYARNCRRGPAATPTLHICRNIKDCMANLCMPALLSSLCSTLQKR